MRAVLQRVSSASVTIDRQVTGKIERGWLCLLGVAVGDTEADATWLAEKVANLRCFPDDAGKMNRSVLDIHGSILVVSNFTLHADCQKGRRPSFIGAAPPDEANKLYESFMNGLKMQGIPVHSGTFGADMHVALVNDGPVTLIVDSPKSPIES